MIGALTGTSSIAVVLKPSRVAIPGASGPKVEGRFWIFAFGAGASGSSGSVLPSSSALKGSGAVPEPESITTCAAEDVVDAGAIWKVVIVAMSAVGNAAERTGNGPFR